MVLLDPFHADDVVFDTVYPARIRLLSRRFWTPVAVARRAAELLSIAGARRVLDVGAGVGKFVLVAAAATPKLDFVGIEQRPHLVQIARQARDQLRIENGHFHLADATEMSWAAFDALYFFNPLAENLFGDEERIDDRVELTARRFRRDALRVEAALRRVRLGCHVITYHGSSTRIPACFDLQTCEPAGTGWLRLWTRRRKTDDGSFFVEVDGGGILHHRDTGDPDSLVAHDRSSPSVPFSVDAGHESPSRSGEAN